MKYGLSFKNNVLVAEVTIAGTRPQGLCIQDVLVDTGATISCFLCSHIKKVNGQPAGIGLQHSVGTMNGTVKLTPYMLKVFMGNYQNLTPVEIARKYQVEMIDEHVLGDENNAVIGTDILKRFDKIELDWKSEKVTFCRYA